MGTGRSMVRLTGVTIRNFKNVVYGNLSFPSIKEYKASVLGLYGQNGSGKTAMIDAIDFLKYILRGMAIPNRFADYINVNSDTAKLSFEFRITLPQGEFPAVYEVDYQKSGNIEAQNEETAIQGKGAYRVTIIGETMKVFTISPNKKGRMGRLIDTNTEKLFSPKPKMDMLIGNEKKKKNDLLIAKKIAALSSRSFVFSRELQETIRVRREEELTEEENQALAFYAAIFEALVNYGNRELFVVNTANSGLISLNAQPLSFKYEEKNHGAIGTVILPLDEPAVVPKKMYGDVQKIVQNMNIVLRQLIPGLTIGLKGLGTQITEEGEKGIRFQLMSEKNGKEIALKYESEGIKKIVSILQLLIVVYNQPSFTVAIDELDSGVFEYLLGELLRIISEKGKGQLLFTSHNLRPLETLDKGFVAFTTVNPKNRYIRMNNVKENHNLRDFYYRDILLGEQNEIVYESTNNAEIAFAFREAGDVVGS